MKNGIYTRLLRARRAVPVLALMVLFAACDTTQSVSQEPALADANLNTVAENLTTSLALSPAQAEDVRTVLAKYEDERTPGTIWYAAADLQATLTSEQIARMETRLAERAQARQSENGQGRPGMRGPQGTRGQPGMRRPQGARGPQGTRGQPGHGQDDDALHGPLADLLTDEQKATLTALQTAHRTQMKEIMAQRQAGTLSEEDAHAQMKTLREAMKTELEALLTEEQKATLEANRTERQAAHEDLRAEMNAARADALGLSPAQQTTLEALHTSHRAETDALRETLRDGNGDREAVGTVMREMMTRHRAEMDEVLTDTQREIVTVHRALSTQMIAQRMKHEKAGRSGARSRRGSRRGR